MEDKKIEAEASGKKNFLLGLSVGVAAISLVGFLLMSAAYFSKDGIPSIPQANDRGYFNKTQNNSKAQANSALTTPEKLDVASQKINNEWVRGNPNAKVTIVEYSDIQCPFCQRYQETLQQVMKAYPDQVKWIFKEFPLESIHPYAKKAALAAECAGAQGKFWEYLDLLYANQSSLGDSNIFTDAAKTVGIDADKLGACLADETFANKIAQDQSEGQAKGIRGTPGSFINGQEVKGAQPFEALKAIIDAELAKKN